VPGAVAIDVRLSAPVMLKSDTSAPLIAAKTGLVRADLRRQIRRRRRSKCRRWPWLVRAALVKARTPFSTREAIAYISPQQAMLDSERISGPGATFRNECKRAKNDKLCEFGIEKFALALGSEY
jgi:hypothetical protein